MPAPTSAPVTDFKHATSKRKHIPPAGAGPAGKLEEQPKIKFAYDPHRTPALRFNENITRHRELLEKATKTPLTKDEVAELASQLESPQPWLEWAGKREQTHFEVEPVALHIHERVSARAILKAVQREEVQRDLFAESQAGFRDSRAYYQHDVDWANRLILGDSLQVMTSLARREGLAGQVQMIYIDPPYGIKFSSNWQNEVGKRSVLEKDEDLTREPELIRAYRDTWTLGVHSYLAYLKQRFILARELLTDSGSIFVQISDENLHRVRAVMDEVFGAENFCSLITFRKKMMPMGAEFTEAVSDYLLWYAKNPEAVKVRPLFVEKQIVGDSAWACVELPSGERRRLVREEIMGNQSLPTGAKVYQPISLLPAQYRPRQDFKVRYMGVEWSPPKKNCWKTDRMDRLVAAERLHPSGETLRYVLLHNDYSVGKVTNLWADSSAAMDMQYVVQTSTEVVKRCMLMTTDPGDLVLDPTCGSGTTAFVAEQWGRRWITIDSSRVAAAIARQRLLTASFETYKTRDPQAGVDPNQPLNPRHGFHYKTVPHITLGSIAQNNALDPIVARHEPILAERLAALNAALEAHAKVRSREGDELRRKLAGKLLAKLRESARSVTDADDRRWILPGTDPQLFQAAKGGPTTKQVADLRAFASARATQWQEWEVPFDTDPDWPHQLQAALTAYRAAWRAKMDEVNKCIEANAKQEEIVDQPEVVRGVVRVSGPFTVESVRPMEDSLKGDMADEKSSPIGGGPGQYGEDRFHTDNINHISNEASHIDRMVSLLKHDGVTFLGNKHVAFSQNRLDRMQSGFLHAEGEYDAGDGKERKIAVVIGPEHGSVPGFQIEQALRSAYKRGYDDLVVAGFSFDAIAQQQIQEHNDDASSEVRIHMAQIRPDVHMGDLLKKTNVSAQIFTVFGQPRTMLKSHGKDEFTVRMEGVDIYDPVKNSIEATDAGKVAAWFVDTDYDGRTFCICQAFFPDKSAWEKLARALKSTLGENAFDAFGGPDAKESLPFTAGPSNSVAVKVIDPRGNEVMRVHRLDGKYA
jgi:adenine-specific DNA-methyltransferase